MFFLLCCLKQLECYLYHSHLRVKRADFEAIEDPTETTHYEVKYRILLFIQILALIVNDTLLVFLYV